MLPLLLRTSLLLSFLRPTTLKFHNKNKTHTKENSDGDSTVLFEGVQRVLGVVASPEDFFAAVFPSSHYSEVSY